MHRSALRKGYNRFEKLTATRIFVLLLIIGSHCGFVAKAAEQAITLHSFTTLDGLFENSDGAYPSAGLVLGGTALYGTATQGGQNARGTVFRLNTDGTGFSAFYNFSATDLNTGTNTDGAFPLSSLILASNALYGTCSAGGNGANGTVFKLNVDGANFTTLHAFTPTDPNSGQNADGASPWANLVISNNVLYGTTSRGGDSGSGTVFRLNSDGTGFTRLHSFSALDPILQTNSDGAYPLGGLVAEGDVLYGTTYRGGGLGTGTVFKINFDGTGFTKLHDNDGGSRGALVVSNNVLYGTTDSGGSFGGGTVFRLGADGSGFTNLHEFVDNAAGGPWAGLILSSNSLFGTTYSGGDQAHGSVFEIQIDGTGFSSVYSFAAGQDGAAPQASLVLADGILYGTASEGGTGGDGTAFSLSLAGGLRQLAIAQSGANVVLSWPTAATGLTLQSATNVFGAWTPISATPTIVNGINFVTNPISGPTRFYRLNP